MNAFAANLKTFYQCPGLWLWHAIGVAFVIDGVVLPVARPVAGEGVFMKGSIVSMWIGLVVASMVKDTLTRPLMFGLPGHQRTVRSLIFAVGAVQALLLSLIVLAYPGLSAGASLAGMASTAFFCFTIYLLTVYAIYRIGNAAAFWGLPVLFFALTRHVITGVPIAIEDAMVFHPWANAGVMLAVAVSMWFWLGRREVARRMCGSAFLPMQSMFNRAATDRYARSRRLRNLDRYWTQLWHWADTRFLSRMRRLPALSARRHACGAHYSLLGSVAPGPVPSLVTGALIILVFLAVLGFAPAPPSHGDFSRANFLCLLPAILAVVIQLPLYSALLVPGGRRERFRSCLSIGVTSSAVAMVLGGVLYVVSLSIGVLLPQVTVSDGVLPYRPMDVGSVLMTLFLMPLLFMCQIFSRRNAQIGQLVVLTVMTLFMMAAPGIFGPGLIPTLAVMTGLAWWCFVGSLRDACYHRDLTPG